jgi:choline transport protein
VIAFFIIFVISMVQWIVDGRKNFTGPRFDADALQNGEVVGMDPGSLRDGSVSGSVDSQKASK